MPIRVTRAGLLQLWRYYQAGIVNTAFGLGVYSLLIWIGLNIYAAQLLGHLIGMAFNYVTYSRHVFRGAAPARGRFILSYAANYLVGLGTLLVLSRYIANPYLLGVAVAFIASIVNFFALRYLVFQVRAA